MYAALVWVMVNLTHPVPHATGYAYPSLAACQHAMDVFNRSPSTWTCRSITVVSDVGRNMPPLSMATLLRGKRNAAYGEAKLHELMAHPFVPGNVP